MSNYLAIATVTATLQKMLQEEVSREMAGVQVTTLRPDAVSTNVSGACLNIYMYQATPNPGWRNAD
ncbi:MAG: Pvc16 family protein, partial [Cyanobacteria bacterium P01_D01_bin.2]